MSWSSPERLGAAAGVVMQYGAAARVTVALLLVLAVGALLFVGTRFQGGGSTAAKVFLALVSLALGAATVDVFGGGAPAPGGRHRARRALAAPGRGALGRGHVDGVGRGDGLVRAARAERRADPRHRQLSGMAAFARAALEGVPAGVIDAQPGLRHRLEQLARGVGAPTSPSRSRGAAADRRAAAGAPAAAARPRLTSRRSAP